MIAIAHFCPLFELTSYLANRRWQSFYCIAWCSHLRTSVGSKRIYSLKILFFYIITWKPSTSLLAISGSVRSPLKAMNVAMQKTLRAQEVPEKKARARDFTAIVQSWSKGSYTPTTNLVYIPRNSTNYK